MERLLHTRAKELNLVQKQAIKARAKQLGFQYTARPFVTEERVRSLLATNLTRDSEIAEGVACIGALMQATSEPQEIIPPHPVPTEDPGRVFQILQELVRFEQKQVNIEEEIITKLNQVEVVMNQFRHEQQQYGRNEDIQDIPGLFFQDFMGEDEDYFQNWSTPMQFDPVPDPWILLHQALDHLSNAEELFNRHIINRWKSSQLLEDQWIWSDCPKIYELLKRMVPLALCLFAMYKDVGAHTTYIDHVLLNIFNDCFLVQNHPARFCVYKSDERLKRGQNVEFRHLLNEFFTTLGDPVLSVVDEDRVPSVFNREKGSFSCARIRNSVGIVVDEGPSRLSVKFANVKIGNPRPREARASDSSTKRRCVSQTKYRLVCEMIIDVPGWKSGIKITSITLPIIIGTNTCQSPLSWVTIRFENAGFSRRRGRFVAPERLQHKKILRSVNQLKIAKLGESLSEVNLQCLTEALQSIGTNGTVSLEELYTAKIPDAGLVGITFYDFVYGQIDLADAFEDFKQLWQRGLVMGWIKREHLHTLLQNRPIGTLLIRAALSKKGVVVTWTCAGGVASLQPLTLDDLKVKGLVQRIEEIAPQINFSFIYPEYTAEMLSSENAPGSPPPSPSLDDELPASARHLIRTYVQMRISLEYPPELARP